MLTKEAFAEWQSNPTTQEIYKELKMLKLSLQELLSDGQTLGPSADETHGNTSMIVGHIKGLNQLLNIDFEKNEKEENPND